MIQSNQNKPQWQFWVDRGGTFTDIVARHPDGKLLTKKLLSENPDAYDDAALHGIREFLSLESKQTIPFELIKNLKMGTTVATNALLERRGEKTVLAISAGLEDIIEIGNQARPDIFALEIKKPDVVYTKVISIHERINTNGKVEKILDRNKTRLLLEQAFEQGYRSLAIVLMHSYKYPQHEKKVAQLAEQVGFKQISTSHEISPLIKIVPRGETTIVDAYLTPILKKYVNRIESSTTNDDKSGSLLFMQSSGGLIDAKEFTGRDAILSGPAGGVVGAVHTAKVAGFDKIIGFDMGGTSTDVSHYAGEYEKVYEAELAGVKMQVPMLNINTVAAGGGSLLEFDGDRFRVGPESAGANPGPVCYRRGGALTVTDINVCLGKIQANYFPKLFGVKQNLALDHQATLDAFTKIASQISDEQTPQQVAEGFLEIAIEHMAQAIKKISVSRGYDVQNYVLNCFGGAGGQHACLVAERLGMQRILLHPLAGVMSAYGIGLADISVETQKMFGRELKESVMVELQKNISSLRDENRDGLLKQGYTEEEINYSSWVLLCYQGVDTTIQVYVSDSDQMIKEFEQKHLSQYGFLTIDKPIYLESIGVNSFVRGESLEEKKTQTATSENAASVATTDMFSGGVWHRTSVYKIEDLKFGHSFDGPAIIIEPIGTIIVEPDWRAVVTQYNHIILERTNNDSNSRIVSDVKDPVQLEIFNNLFMSIAEQMGIVLRNTARSVNIKERLDFSCAIFDQKGSLVANAPHVPVHLGSMDSSVKVVINSGQEINAGDVFVQNNPFNGGSHLPDITVITPVFNAIGEAVVFYLASRAHHEDIGGIAPGSMSPLATNIHQEGIVIDCLKLVDQGEFMQDNIHAALSSGQYPARNIEQNITDLKAQIAANNTGVNELQKLVKSYSLKTVHAYMGFIQDNAEQSIKKVLAKLKDGRFEHQLDSGAIIKVTISIDHDQMQAIIDFTGTSDQQNSNFNAPRAITHAAVLYVFRCLVDDDIPLNSGCMRPLNIIIPEGSMLSPNFPAAVVAGNVESSQSVTNALFAALGVLGSSQGTMNNLTFGNGDRQYYETICSGSSAGPDFNGVAAVHTHMTNTRMTDPEILEQRYPVVLENFSIRRNSGGRGKWNAGDGIFRRIRFLQEMELSILSDHRRVPPFGVKGGDIGELGENWIERADSSIENLKGCAHTKVNIGDAINISTPTGGGFGKEENK